MEEIIIIVVTVIREELKEQRLGEVEEWAVVVYYRETNINKSLAI